MNPKASWWRFFDREYWQMRTALGCGGPHWADKRFGLTFKPNPYTCGSCEARRRYPGLHVSCDITHFRERLTGYEREDFEHRLRLAMRQHSQACASRQEGSGNPCNCDGPDLRAVEDDPRPMTATPSPGERT